MLTLEEARYDYAWIRLCEMGARPEWNCICGYHGAVVRAATTRELELLEKLLRA